MNIDKYFKDVTNKIDKLSDKEFEQLLIESGIDKCEYDKEDNQTKDSAIIKAIDECNKKYSKAMKNLAK